VSRGRFKLLRSLTKLHQWIDSQRKINAARVDQETWRTNWLETFEEERLLFSHILKSMRPRPEVLPLLEHYKAIGAVQVALSDLESRYKIELLGLAPYFSEYWSTFEVGHWKPSPVAFRRLHERWRIAPAQHLHIGDRLETDAEGAQAAGCSFKHLAK
jgi:FMN phosphatase YigB (HAD superfamily)